MRHITHSFLVFFSCIAFTYAVQGNAVTSFSVVGSHNDGAVLHLSIDAPDATAYRISERPNLIQHDWHAYSAPVTQQWVWLGTAGSNSLYLFTRDAAADVTRTSITVYAANDMMNTICKATFGYFTYGLAQSGYLPYGYYPGGNWCNSTEIGLWALAWILAYDIDRPWSPEWHEVQDNIIGCLSRIRSWQVSGNVYDHHAFYQFYTTETGNPTDTGVPSVDNALLDACLYVINGYCKRRSWLEGADSITNLCAQLLAPKDYSIWYESVSRRFGWLHTTPGNCANLSDENQIINVIARMLSLDYGTWSFPASEFVRSVAPAALQQYYREYDGIPVVATGSDGSLFTYLFPAQFIREMETAYGTGTINRAVECQIRYMENNNRHAFGISDGHGPPPEYPYQMGCPPRASNNPNDDPDKGVIIPGALIMSSITDYRIDTANALHYVLTNSPLGFSSLRGFRGSLSVTSSAMSSIFSELDDGHAMLALANCMNETAWNGFYANASAVTMHQEMFGDYPNDITPPVIWRSPDEGFYSNEISVTLSAHDTSAGSGVKEIWYTTDVSSPLTSPTRMLYTAPIMCFDAVTMKVTAIDYSGNEAKPETFTYNVIPEPLLFLPLFVCGLVFFRKYPKTFLSICFTVATLYAKTPGFGVNVGGNEFTAKDHTHFYADTSCAAFTVKGGETAENTNPVKSIYPHLHASGRWGDFSYSFPLSNGMYRITLFFSENYFEHPGQRVFHIKINNEPIAKDVDILAYVGAHNEYKKSFIVLVTQTVLNLSFTPVFDAPSLNGIVISPETATSYVDKESLVERTEKKEAEQKTFTAFTWHTTSSCEYVAGGTPVKNGRVGNMLLSLPVSNGVYDITARIAPPFYPRWGKLRINEKVIPSWLWKNYTCITRIACTDSVLRIAWDDPTRRVPFSFLSVQPACSNDIIHTTPPPRVPQSTLNDDAFLDHVARAAFDYFIYETDPITGLTRDTSRAPFSSTAACGFELCALAYGVDQNWISRADAHARTMKMLNTLERCTPHTKHGMYPHFLKLDGTPISHGETGTSTIDSALLFMGMLTAGEFFGGEVKRTVNDIIKRVNWRAYYDREKRFVYMGWTPQKPGVFDGPGNFGGHWCSYTDETILINLLARGAPNPAFRLPGDIFYAWERPRVSYHNGPSFIRSYPHNLFTYTFAHLWIDFKKIGVDKKGVDWWSNTVHAAQSHRQYCINRSDEFVTFSSNRWGLSPCVVAEQYVVPHPMPNGAGHDYNIDGSIAPYAAAMALPFMPRESIDALREMYQIELSGVSLWQPQQKCGYGFWDSFTMDRTPPLVTQVVVGIDQGPLLMSIANYRHGFFWKIMAHNTVIKNALTQIGFENASK